MNDELRAKRDRIQKRAKDFEALKQHHAWCGWGERGDGFMSEYLVHDGSELHIRTWRGLDGCQAALMRNGEVVTLVTRPYLPGDTLVDGRLS